MWLVYSSKGTMGPTSVRLNALEAQRRLLGMRILRERYFSYCAKTQLSIIAMSRLRLWLADVPALLNPDVVLRTCRRQHELSPRQVRDECTIFVTCV